MVNEECRTLILDLSAPGADVSEQHVSDLRIGMGHLKDSVDLWKIFECFAVQHHKSVEVGAIDCSATRNAAFCGENDLAYLGHIAIWKDSFRSPQPFNECFA